MHTTLTTLNTALKKTDLSLLDTFFCYFQRLNVSFLNNFMYMYIQCMSGVRNMVLKKF